MSKQYQNNQKQPTVTAIWGLLIGLLATLCQAPLAFAIPSTETSRLLSQMNSPTDSNPTPVDGSTSPAPLNPRPSIFNEAPYNRSSGATPIEQPKPGAVPQIPLPEQQQAPSALVMPMNGMINITLKNATNAVIVYQVIGDTEPRTLLGDSEVTLQKLRVPVTVTFVREDKGLLKVIPQATSEGLLEVTLDETTSLDEDRGTMRVQATGGVFLN